MRTKDQRQIATKMHIFAFVLLCALIGQAQSLHFDEDGQPLILGAAKEKTNWTMIPKAEPKPKNIAAISLPGIRNDITPDNPESLNWDSVRLGNAPEERSTTSKLTVSHPKRNPYLPIVVSAKKGWTRETERYNVLILEGDCSITQGTGITTAPRAVVWVPKEEKMPFDGVVFDKWGEIPEIPNQIPATKITVFLESTDSKNLLQVEMDPELANVLLKDAKWLGEFTTYSDLQYKIENMNTETPSKKNWMDYVKIDNSLDVTEFFARADVFRRGEEGAVKQMQFIAVAPSENSLGIQNANVPFRRIRFHSRNDIPMDVRYISDPISNRGTTLVTNGFNLIVEGVKSNDVKTGGGIAGMLSDEILDISADRGLIWSEELKNLQDKDVRLMSQNLDFEIYLEGNIVFRQGDRVIFADRMYYDAKNKIGYVLHSEMYAPFAEGFGGSALIRMKSDVLQQTGPGTYTAHNSFITTSRLGQPEYKLQSRQMTLQERSVPRLETLTGTPIRDSATGLPIVDRRFQLTAESNSVYYRALPILYWPWMSADLRDSTFYIRNLRYAHDGDFGHQIKTTWNPWQILNIKNRPEGMDWDVTFDYLSARGFGHGTNVTYSRNGFLFFPGPSAGIFDYYGINDTGKDNLGLERRELTFPDSYRYRALWTHRQALGSDWILTAELGKQSDRNFLRQYFPNEWETQKDQSTNIELKKIDKNTSLSVFAGVRLNNFVSDTNWMPKLEYTRIGDSLFEDTITLYSHTKVGVAQFRASEAPNSGSQDAKLFAYTPWESKDGTSPFDITSETISTRHEIDIPFNVGPVRFIPYVLGELAHWGKDQNSESINRAYGQFGVRANLPLSKLTPSYHNRMFYANGLAHKIDFDMEISHAKVSTEYNDLVLYESMDDDSIEDFRRRYIVTTFNGNLPVWYDPRYYAIRSGVMGNVTSTNTELASDLTTLRFGMKNRWQTKRGAVGRRHIVDWITLDTNFTIFPESNQNFGQNVGLIDYDFRWHVGDRFSVLSSGIYDVFDDGQKITRFGVRSHRPDRGSVYFGLDRLDGYFRSTYLNLNVEYIMSQKYAMTYATSYDLEEGRNLGHAFKILRSGESFRFGLSFSYDWSRNNVGFGFDIVPTALLAYSHRNNRDSYPGIIPQ